MPKAPADLTKRPRVTRHQKLVIIKHADESPGIALKELAGWTAGSFSLASAPTKSTMSRLLAARGDILDQPVETLTRKKACPPWQLEIDVRVVEFVMLAEVEKISITGAMIINYAKDVADKMKIPMDEWPNIGPSWLRCLQACHGFKWRRPYGESSSVGMELARQQISSIKRVINTYRPCDVYNMDESAFFYSAVPRGSICKNAAPALKQNKSRVTMAVCTNADGSDKLPLLFLGRAVSPRWYSQKPASLQYMGTERGWMTAWMYQQWLVGLNEQMRASGRHILLLVDNASSHHEIGLTLTNVRVERLPPNTTAKAQPLDQGIIYCIKRYVLNEKMLHALEHIGESIDRPYEVDLLTALIWCEAA